MIQRILQSRYAQAVSRLASWAQGWLIPALLRRRIFGAALVSSLLAAFYWGVIASDRYVSEAHVVIVRAYMPSGGSQTGSLVGSSDSGNAAELIAFQLWLRDYLLSVDMMNALDARLKLREHFSDRRWDILSRMWFQEQEHFHNYFLSRVSVELDSNTGSLVIKVQGYDPDMAHAIADMMVKEGEHYMNVMAQRMVGEQMSFLETQADDLKKRDIQAHQLLLDFQNRKGLVSPLTTAASIDTVVNSLDSQRTALQASRNALLAYLMPNSPSVLVLDQQIAGIEKQINTERSRLVSTKGSPLNNLAEEFLRLQMNADLVDTTYKAALAALEAGRVQAALSMRKVLVLQAPSMPQYPLEPRRIYNTIVFILAMLLVAGIVHLLAAIIRDHKD